MVVASAIFLAIAVPAVEVDLNAGWTRVVGQDSRVVDLPDDFNINMPWCEAAGGNRGFKSVTNGVYRRQFMADARWRGKRVFLDLDGVQSVCDVAMNGSRVASWDYGSLGFETELTDRINWTGPNEIEVRCMTGGEKSCRWYAGCGITRGAKLVVRNRLAFARHGIRIVTSNLSVRRADVDVSVEVSGLKKDDLPATVFVQVFSPDGRQVGSASCELTLVDAGGQSMVVIRILTPGLIRGRRGFTEGRPWRFFARRAMPERCAWKSSLRGLGRGVSNL